MVFYDITLVRKSMFCHYCSSNMIVHGHKQKLLIHYALRDHKGIVRYTGKECMRAILDNWSI